MFTPKNIQGALEELYDLCDPDYMVDMLVNYSEEFDDISPALLAKSFQKNAEMISEYRVLSSAGEGIDYLRKLEPHCWRVQCVLACFLQRHLPM